MVGLHDGQAPGQLLALLVHDRQDAHVPWRPLAQGLQPAGQVSQHMFAREPDNKYKPGPEFDFTWLMVSPVPL